MPVVASEGVARQQDEVLAAWKRDLEAARYAAQRAQKQYDAADPENRLVADELERRWNQTMSAALLARVGSVFADVNHQGIESQRASDSSPGPKRLFKTEVLGIEITVERIEMGDRCRLRMGQVPPADTDHPSCPSEPTTERFGVA